MKKKKIISLALSAVLLLSNGVSAAGTSAVSKDYDGHWASAAIEKWRVQGVLKGFSDGSMGPDQPVTRAELAAMLDNIMDYQETAENLYADCDDSAWYAGAVLRASAAGVISGDGLHVRPEAAAARQEAAVMMAHVLELDGSGTEKTSFADDDSIADYARGAVAALKAAGLMSGNPQNCFEPEKPITRAEMAQVLSNMFDLVLKGGESCEETETGTVVLQGNGAQMNGQHVTGDVIIAEGVADGAAVLKDVTVDGRILVRGGGVNSIHLNGTKAEHVVMDKNGEGVRLVIGSDAAVSHVTVAEGTAPVKVEGNPETITVRGQGASLEITGTVGSVQFADSASGAVLTVSGQVAKVESGAANVEIKTTAAAKIQAITANAPGMTISGTGSVASVAAKANNIKVETKGTTVTAALGTSGVTAAGSTVAPGASGLSGSGSGNGGSSGNGSGSGGGSGAGGSDSANNSGGSSNAGDTGQTAAALVDAAQTGIRDLGWCQYVAIAFENGYNKDNCIVKIDGVDVTAGVTNVTDDGSIAKWELASLSPARLTVAARTDADKVQTVTLTGNSAPEAPQGGINTAPAYILAHGAVSSWDYYLTNYDDNGNVRISPTKTTFDLTSGVKSYSPDAELKRDVNAAYGVSGTVEILFNYNTEDERQWFDAVAEHGGLALVSRDENKITLNRALNYTKSTEAHGEAVTGVLRIPLGQSNFFSNGRYYVRVLSAGHETAMVPIHVVNETEPKLTVSESGKLISGKNIHFKVSHMTYGITVPMETVMLTDPWGKTRTLEKITDWYLLGDLLVLYNDVEALTGRNNIPDNGVYTITVHSNGFKSMSKTFEVTGGRNDAAERTGQEQYKPQLGLAKALGVDAISGATSSGGGSSSEDSGGISISADLLFDADLLINALLLQELGVRSDAAEGIVSRWETELSGYDAVYGQSGSKFYTWSAYSDAVREAKLKGQYLSFAEYIASDSAETTENRPYAVKEILEDNLLGETQYGGVYKGKTPPAMSLDGGAFQVDQGQDAVLTGAPAEYLSAITEIFLEGNWKGISPEDYELDLDLNKLVIKSSLLKLGDNTVEIRAEGYKNNTLRITCGKVPAQVTLELAGGDCRVGRDVVVNVAGSAEDFLKNLQGVTLNGNPLLTEAAGGISGNDWYEAGESAITLKGGLFAREGQYTLTVTAEYYGEKELTFTVAAAEAEPPADTLAAPAVSSFEKKSEFFIGSYYRVSFRFGEKELEEYLKAVETVRVGDQWYTRIGGMLTSSDKAAYKLSNNEAYGVLSYVDFTMDGFLSSGHTTVVISAKGYEDLSFTVDEAGALTEL